MDKIVSSGKTMDLVRAHDFTFRKKYGQNFLTDERVIYRTIEAAGITKDDCVVEIGPGIGSLTQYLCEAAGQVVAVEIDEKLIPILAGTLASYDNVTVLHQDILESDLQEISETYGSGRPLKVVANLPYYITTPIIMQLLESRAPVRSITVMVQKEVADRMRSGPGSKEYGALSLAVQYYSRVSIAANVPAHCFVPRPNVDSAVVHLDCEGKPDLNVRDEKQLFALIRASFNQRRKTLANAVKNAPGLPYSREQVIQALQQIGLSENIRGEAMTLQQFGELSDALS